ncbi:MAG: hypothetical protein MRZ79_08530 [Bacteroidia bacterium]|nr:hypothetical protein [Bacteroidia bacterium]
MLKKSFSLFSLLFLFFPLTAQNNDLDSLDIVGIAYVNFDDPSQNRKITIDNRLENCFQITRNIHRLNLDMPKNRFLALQRDKNRHIVGLLPLIIKQMQQGKLIARDAKDNKTPYTYEDLLTEMFYVEEMEQELYADTVDASILTWANLATRIDLITSECFDKNNSRWRRITHSVRINYCDPKYPKRVTAMMIFPLEDIAILLKSLNYRNGRNALDLLLANQYVSFPFDPKLDGKYTLTKPNKD